ncbi:uncharacterized protein BCR38DRAFT_382160 [Pseudomassariella vexata]|uniref:LPXTG-domain-containing protein n=1 Tax=Pseudomassariella vexata TaxID=1141098 RepID=A0A1Y2EIV6_9PEZI|nr:uncharacterized protein BCR38DRAFT_382160 [Pseudomassariella vexata]ORY71509.1 hypothetical protein BCR38DRAFT_382160 [Pseudomassariella vexata]
MSRILVINTLLRASAALLVATGSPCGTKCGNVLDSTSTDDLVCRDSDYSQTAGVVWSNCLNCELSSPYSKEVDKSTRSDLQAMLYNMRFATSHCLFSDDEEDGSFGTNPCITTTACGPLKAAIEYDGLESNATAYGYCSLWSDLQASKCDACLTNMENAHFFLNYINVLNGACKMQPTPGLTLALEGSIFSADTVNVTTPTPTATFTASGPSGPLSLGAIVGVAVAGTAVLLGVAGFCIVANGKRRRKAYLRKREQQYKNNHWPSPGVGGEMFETPVSQKPLRGWDESPVSAGTDSTYPRYISPYSSQYNSPVSALDGPSHMNWPSEKTQNIGVALSPDGERSNDFWGDKKGKDRAEVERDEYELQEGVNNGGGQGQQYPYVSPPPPMAPTLGHPGYGRHGPTPQQSGRGTPEEDFI